MKSSLFRRLFFAVVGILLVTILSFTGIMCATSAAQQRSAYEAELKLQARDLAQLVQGVEMTSLWRVDPADVSTFQWKITEIQKDYQASVWLVYKSGYVRILGDSDASSLSSIVLNDTLRSLLSGQEVRAQGAFSELGENTLTIGAPFTTPDGAVTLGGVLLHVDVSTIPISVQSVVGYSVIAGTISMLVGVLLSYLIASRQTRPIRAIQKAVSAFSGGDFTARVPLDGSREMRELAESINRMAEDLSNLEESRKTFVASVSHELRSPMTCIQGYIEGMLDGTIPPEEREKYLGTVLSETKRLTKLVHDLLELSRFESGKFPLSLSDFDVDEMILSTMFKFEQRIEEKHMLVDISFKEQPLYVRADADRIEQVLTNLIDNAVKYGCEGGQLTVWTHSVDSLAYITVKNEGPTIPPGDLPFIFDRFYKVDKAHTSGMGTGLGLSIVKRIIEQHGKTITVTSSGRETAFVFTLQKAAPPQDKKSTEVST